MDTDSTRVTATPTTDDAAHSDPAPGEDAAPGAGTDPVTGTALARRRRFTLYRSRSDVMVAGVCGGLAEELDVDPALLRIAAVALTLFTGGAAALVYLVAWFLMPVGRDAAA